MSWQSLLADQKIRAHTTSKHELDDLRDVIERDLQDAAIVGLSTDRRFATAYNAALQAATLAVVCAGYRTTGLAHHQTTFEAAELALGPASTPTIIYFDTCRRKRNSVDYDRTHVASDTEANEILTKAQGFYHIVENWISINHPPLKKT
jgi:hypothetical protein